MRIRTYGRENKTSAVPLVNPAQFALNFPEMPLVILDDEIIATVISHWFQDAIADFEQTGNDMRLSYIAPALAILIGQNHGYTPYEQKFQCAEYSIVTSAFTISGNINAIGFLFACCIFSGPLIRVDDKPDSIKNPSKCGWHRE